MPGIKPLPTAVTRTAERRRSWARSARGHALFGPLTAIAALVVFAALLVASGARASVSHLVQPGETLSGVAAASGLSAVTLASWNGLDPEAGLIAGTTITVPSAAEAGAPAVGSATASGSSGGHLVSPGETLSSIAAANGITVSALAAANGLDPAGVLLAGTSLSIPAATAATAAAPTPGLGTIPSPWGPLYLEAAAAQAWNAMRAASLSTYGQDLYPAGPVSAYRTSAQQGDLYESFLNGAGSPANPPGSSSHERGLSVDLADPAMRSIVDAIGGAYGWGKLEAPGEWWHVSYAGG